MHCGDLKALLAEQTLRQEDLSTALDMAFNKKLAEVVQELIHRVGVVDDGKTEELLRTASSHEQSTLSLEEMTDQELLHHDRSEGDMLDVWEILNSDWCVDIQGEEPKQLLLSAFN